MTAAITTTTTTTSTRRRSPSYVAADVDDDGRSVVVAQRVGLLERSNRVQLCLHLLLAACVGATLRLTTFAAAAVAARGDDDDHLGYAARTSFLAYFGIAKATTNAIVGRASDRRGRAVPHRLGWACGVVLGAASWWACSSSDAAKHRAALHVLLGVQQGATWTTNIFMWMDVAGPERRATAAAASNATGYAASAATAWIAAVSTPRQCFVGVSLASAAALLVSSLWMEDTRALAAAEEEDGDVSPPSSFSAVFVRTCFSDASSASLCVGGLTANAVTSLSWGLVSVWARRRARLDDGRVAAIDACFTGAKVLFLIAAALGSDRLGRRRRPTLVAGWSAAAVGSLVAATAAFGDAVDDPDVATRRLALGSALAGAGVGAVYCVLTAAVADRAAPADRAAAVGVYKFWRDAGFAAGAALAGVGAGTAPLAAPLATTAVWTACLAAWTATRYEETGERERKLDDETETETEEKEMVDREIL